MVAEFEKEYAARKAQNSSKKGKRATHDLKFKTESSCSKTSSKQSSSKTSISSSSSKCKKRKYKKIIESSEDDDVDKQSSNVYQEDILNNIKPEITEPEPTRQSIDKLNEKANTIAKEEVENEEDFLPIDIPFEELDNILGEQQPESILHLKVNQNTPYVLMKWKNLIEADYLPYEYVCERYGDFLFNFVQHYDIK
jgi:hypothetical protein